MSLSRFEEELLRSAPDDAPSAERRRANRALVMGAAGLAAAAGAGAAAATTAGAGGGGAVAVATKGIGLAKLAIVVAIALGAGAAVLGLTRHGAGARDGSPTTPAQTPAQTSAPAPIASPSPVAAVPPDESGPQAPSPAVAPPAPAPAPSAASAPDPLAIEARLLEAARACANARDYACASAKLAAYETRFPRGALSDEAALLRIEVARGRGDTVAARRLAERLLTSHPSGSYARRARAILAELDGPGDGAAP